MRPPVPSASCVFGSLPAVNVSHAAPINHVCWHVPPSNDSLNGIANASPRITLLLVAAEAAPLSLAAVTLYSVNEYLPFCNPVSDVSVVASATTGSYTHDLYEAESAQIEDKFEEVQELIYTRDTLCTSLQAQADVAHSGTSDPNLIESTMEQAGVDEVTNMETDASRLWFTSLTAGAVVGIDKIIMLIALIVFRIGWWATNQFYILIISLSIVYI